MITCMTMYFRYSSHTLELNDAPDSIEFHIKSGDYFAYVATMLGFMEEALTTRDADETTEKVARLAKQLRHDLRYVQANYHILERAPQDIQQVPRRGNLLAK